MASGTSPVCACSRELKTLPRYVVTHVYEIDADTAQLAAAVSLHRHADRVNVRRAAPAERFGGTRHPDYTQPLQVLDACWDRYMDATLPGKPRQRGTDLPDLVDLGKAGIAPWQLSKVFDLAVSAYIEQVKLPRRQSS